MDLSQSNLDHYALNPDGGLPTAGPPAPTPAEAEADAIADRNLRALQAYCSYLSETPDAPLGPATEENLERTTAPFPPLSEALGVGGVAPTGYASGGPGEEAPFAHSAGGDIHGRMPGIEPPRGWSVSEAPLRYNVDREIDRGMRAQAHHHAPMASLADNLRNPMLHAPGQYDALFMSGANLPTTFSRSFGFNGPFFEPRTPDTVKGVFMTAVKTEIQRIISVQRGVVAYQQAINSREHHIFRPEFLVGQNTGIVVAMNHLDNFRVHMKIVEEEVEKIQDENRDVDPELFRALVTTQRWVARTRAALMHAYIFYKLNIVMARYNRDVGDLNWSSTNLLA